MTRSECIDAAAAIAARDLAAQAALPPEQAARAAGCSTPDEVAVWIDRFRHEPIAAAG